MKPTDSVYQACFPTPFAVLGIRTQGELLTVLEYLPLSTPPSAPCTKTAERVMRRIEAYLADPTEPFDIALSPSGTPFQHRVWKALCAIPVGSLRSYGELARELGTAPRALGGACGKNPIALVIPCHRVIAAGGALGGFMGGTADTPLGIKRWLLLHEGALAHA